MSEPAVITSAANPLVKRIRQLGDRRFRRQQGCFVVEGIQPVGRATEFGWPVQTFVIAPELLPARAAELVAEQEGRGVRVARFSSELFGRVSGRDGPSGLLAIVGARDQPLAGLAVPPGGVFAVLDRVANPGNLGTIIRTVDAAGGAGVILAGDSTDPFGPAAIKASMGSVFALPVTTAANGAEFAGWARRHGVQVVAATGAAGLEHWNSTYRPPVAILLGSERQGLTPDLLAAAELAVRIPMTGSAESLNLAVAAGLMVYEVRRHQIG